MARLDSHSLEHVYLGSGVGESFEDPAVDFAVTLFQPLLHMIVHNIIGHHLSVLHALHDHLSDVGASLDLVLKNLSH